MLPYLPLGQINARLQNELLEATQRVVRSGRYLAGEELARFESEYARYIGTTHCIGCANGLDALTLILRAYKELGVLRNGDDILLSAHTFAATYLAVTENGLNPVPVEPRIDTLQLDPSKLEAALTPRTRALLLVHLYGLCAYTPQVALFCKAHGLQLIEDNAQAHGCRYTDENGTPHLTGSLGHAAGHSFYPGKNLGALGDAGAITTNNDALAAMVRKLGNYGSAEKYVFDVVGRNSRLDEIQAAVLSAKLPRLDADNRRRQAIARRYMAEIHNAQIKVPAPTVWSDAVFHIFPVLTPHREALRNHLEACGVATLIHYPIPTHLQTCYPQLNKLKLPVTEQICNEELSLPCHPAMTDADATLVIEACNAFTAAAHQH